MNLVPNEEGELRVTLKEITDYLGLRHNDKMKTVAKMAEKESFGRLREIRSHIAMPNGGSKMIDTYLLDKRQMMAVSGTLDVDLQMMLVDRLNELEAQLKQPNVPQVMSPAEMMLHQAQLMVDMEKKFEVVDSKIAKLEAKQETHDDYFGLMGYAKYIDFPKEITPNKSKSLGKKATKLSKELGYEVCKIKSTSYGKINAYHKDVLKEVLEEFLKGDN